MADDDLNDFEKTTFTHAGKERAVFRKGTGPAVIVMSEIPGITPKVAGFARRVADLGCTAVMPHLFGIPGKDPDPKAIGTFRTMAYGLSSIVPSCISREFTVWATGRTSPAVEWLRALAAHEHERCGGPGVGAVGMCFTGGFALAMASSPHIVAPVLSQPSLPFTARKANKRSIDCSPEDLAIVKDRCATEGLDVLGLRFRSDKLVGDERFAFLKEQLGDHFVDVTLEDDEANKEAAMKPHSVLTEHLIDEPGPARRGLDAALELFRSKLLTPG